MPPLALRPAFDPMLDEATGTKVRHEVARWSIGIAGALAFALVASVIETMDSATTIAAQRAAIERKDRELATAQHQLALNAAGGNCSTLFYLVEADNMEVAGEKLMAASMQIAEITGSWRDPVPPIWIPAK